MRLRELGPRARDHRARPDPLLPTTRSRDRSRARASAGEPLAAGVHANPGWPRGDLLAVRAHDPSSPTRDPRPPPPRHRARPDPDPRRHPRAPPRQVHHQQASTERRALPAGDYAIANDDDIVGVVERKSLDDLVRRLVDGQLTYAIADLATIPARGRRGRGPLLQPVQARAHQAGVRDRVARGPHRPLSDRPDPLRRDTATGPRNGPTASSAPRSPTTKRRTRPRTALASSTREDHP
jgi:ERCC4 domain-containing protein